MTLNFFEVQKHRFRYTKRAVDLEIILLLVLMTHASNLYKVMYEIAYKTSLLLISLYIDTNMLETIET